jgi:phosphoesterase RecJ-like protein
MSGSKCIRFDHGKSPVAHVFRFWTAKVYHATADTKKKDLHLRRMMKDIQLVFDALKNPSRIVITMHQKPDPDAMGSSLALYHFLQGMGHETTVISPTNWADFLKWMPGADKVIDFESQGEIAKKILLSADWLFCLDFNNLGRTRHMQALLESLSCKKVLIDHHREPQLDSFDYGNSDFTKSSTAEMIYDFISCSGEKELINKEIASCLYAGVVADTGSFRFSSTTPSVHFMVAELMSYGIEHARIHSHIYDNFQENRLRLIGHVLSNRLEVLYEYNTALIAIPKSDILRFHIKTGDTEGLVNYPLSIQGIEMAALLIDRDEERKWSFRSKESFDCNTFARTYFEGGGHYNASGGRSSESVEENVKRFKMALKEFTINTKQ